MTIVTNTTPAHLIPRDEPFVFQPGNGSRFDVLLNNGDSGLTIGVIGKGCYRFMTCHHYAYIASKLQLMDGDAMHFAALISKIFA